MRIPKFVNAVLIAMGFIFGAQFAYANCKGLDSSNKNLVAASSFLSNAIYALHIQYLNENFTTKEAAHSRAQLFDTVFNSPYWASRAKSRQSSNLLWNWVRVQYWGAINQQALLKEEQGFKSNLNRGTHLDLDKIYKFPAYPVVTASQVYNCTARDHSFYPCNETIQSFEVTLSPTLACADAKFKSNLTFDYLMTKTNHGWAILDVQFKGFNLVRDTFRGFDDLSNKYGNSKALAHSQRLYSLPYSTSPNDQVAHSGEIAFKRKFKYSIPKYPLNY